MSGSTTHRRILVIDDNRDIHDDFRKLLSAKAAASLDDLEDQLFGSSERTGPRLVYDVDSALQGEEGFGLVKAAVAGGRPYATAFVDMRMPPGWDGLTTIERIFEVDAEIQIVICTAYSEYSWEDIVRRFPGSDRLLILRKPFDTAEVCQLAAALTEKWHLARRAHLKRSQLEALVAERTTELRESQSRYALAAAGARDGLWDWDLSTGHVYYSARWRSMLGLAETGNEATPQLWLDLVHPADQAGLLSALDEHFAGTVPYIEHEYRATHADGQLRWFLCRGIAVRDPSSGKALRVAGSQTDITDRKLAEEQLRVAALHDSLTGLPNRALLQDRLALCMERARRDPTLRHAVLYIDLDRFKMVNDTFGHAAGDDLLCQFGARVLAQIRAVDTVARHVHDPLARFGGDEFVLLVEGLRTQADSLRIAERVLQAVAEPFQVAGQRIQIGCSIGVALDDERYQGAQEMLRDADLALYHAKTAGRNRYEVFDRAVHASTLKRWELEGEMRAAIGTGAFFVEYQPVVSIETGTIHGVEALVRWNHPRLGRVSPADFVPLAEETGLIVPIGIEILETACRDFRRWRDANPDLGELRLAVNVSPRQLAAGRLAPAIAAVLEATGVDPRHVDLEITESVLMDTDPQRLSELQLLRAAGHRLLLDDFGTGYCSLSYLRRVQVDTLKIDRSFVQAMNEDAMTDAIVRAIVTLADSFGLGLIAEGVETEEQRQRLLRLDVGLAQGFMFWRPLSAKQIAELLSGRARALAS